MANPNCGAAKEFKNRFVENMSYPMPALENILPKVQGATTHQQLTLNHSYLQLKLDGRN